MFRHTLCALLLSLPAAAFADGPRYSFSFNVGTPYYEVRDHGHRGYRHHWRGHGYRPSFYYYEVPVIREYEVTRIVQAPPVPVVSGPPPKQSWYFCEDADEYYPYVRECPGGWRTVPATPRR